MVRAPEIKKQAELLRGFFAEQGVTLTHRQSLDRVARLHGHTSWQVMEKHLRMSSPAASNNETFKFKASREIAIIWNISDVLTVRPDLTDDQCMEVLHKVERNHDCERGINWDVIEQAANAYEGWTIEAEFCEDGMDGKWEVVTVLLWNGEIIAAPREEYLASNDTVDFPIENRWGAIRFKALQDDVYAVDDGSVHYGESEYLAALCATLRNAGVSNDGRGRSDIADSEQKCGHCGEVFDVEELDESDCTWQQVKCPCCGSWEDRKRFSGR